MRRILFMTLIVGPLLGGCSTAIDAPSLAPRAVERTPVALPDQASEPELAASAALTAKLDTIVVAAEAAHRDFERQQSVAGAAVRKAAGAAEGSETWLRGQQALSALDAAQGPVRDKAGEIDTMRQDSANYGSGDRAAIEAAAAKVEALSDAEAKAIADLGGTPG